MKEGDLVRKVFHNHRPCTDAAIGVITTKFHRACAVIWPMQKVDEREWTIEWDHDLVLVQKAEE